MPVANVQLRSELPMNQLTQLVAYTAAVLSRSAGGLKTTGHQTPGPKRGTKNGTARGMGTYKLGTARSDDASLKVILYIRKNM